MIIVIILAAGISLGAYVWGEMHRDPLLEVHIFQVQNSLVAFIRTPEDRRILINGGPNAEVVRHITRVLPFYSRRIDAVIAVDTQTKNVTGLIDVINRYHISEVYVPAVTMQSIGLASSSGPAYEVFRETIANKQVVAGEEIILRELIAGDFVSFGDVEVTVLFPALPEDFAYSRASAPEAVLRISYGKTSLLWSGTITSKIQRYVADHWEVPEFAYRKETDMNEKEVEENGGVGSIVSDVLIVSRNASTDMAVEFVRAVRHTYIVHSQAIQKVSARAQSSLRKKSAVSVSSAFVGITSKNVINLKHSGKVVFVSDGSNIWIN